MCTKQEVNANCSMDLALFGMEAASLYPLEIMCKGEVYSIKLKLELVVLGKLIQSVGGSPSDFSQPLDDLDVSEFVDLEQHREISMRNRRTRFDCCYLGSRFETRQRTDVEAEDYEFARFEHGVDDRCCHFERLSSMR